MNDHIWYCVWEELEYKTQMPLLEFLGVLDTVLATVRKTVTCMYWFKHCHNYNETIAILQTIAQSQRTFWFF